MLATNSASQLYLCQMGAGFIRSEGRHSGCHDICADAIVICAGCSSRDFAASLGDRLNIYPVKGYSITVELDEPASQEAAPWVSLA